MISNCSMQENAALPALSIRTRAPVFRLAKVFGEAYAAIEKHIASLGETPAGAPYAAYFNMNMFSLDIEIGIPVKKNLPGNGKIEANVIPAGKSATIEFIGPYGKISPAYKELQRWMKQQNLQPTGVAYEFYLNDPATTPPAELKTRVVFPLK